MINIEKKECNLYLVSDDEYYPDRYSVILNFLEKQRLEVLDYKITLTQIITGVDFTGFNIHPNNLNESFEDVLKGLNDAYQKEKDEDEDDDDVRIDLEILCQTKPFELNIAKLLDKNEYLSFLEEIRHYLVTTDNLIVCDDENKLKDESFWKQEHRELINKIDEKIKEME